MKTNNLMNGKSTFKFWERSSNFFSVAIASLSLFTLITQSTLLAQPETMPDLVVSEFSYNFDGYLKLSAGKKIIVTYTPSNTNAAVIVKSYGKTKFYLSANESIDNTDLLLEERDAPVSVSPVHAGYFDIPLTVAAGAYYIFLQLDANNEIAESDETNNITSFKIIVEENTLDYRVSGLSLSNMNPEPGDSISVRYYLSNEKSVHFTDDYLLKSKIYLSPDNVLGPNDELIGVDSTLVDFYKGFEYYSYKSVKVKINKNIPYSKFFIIVVVDPENILPEINESNNVSSVEFKVSIPFDFIVHNISLPSDTLVIGRSFSFYSNVEIYNPLKENYILETFTYLSLDATFDKSDKLVAKSGKLKTSMVVNNNITLKDSIPQGFYYLITTIDMSNSFHEKNENNNVAISKFYLRKSDIDLSITKTDVITTDYSSKNYIYLKSGIQNTGKDIASLSFTSFYISNDAVYSKDDKFLHSIAKQSLDGKNTMLINLTFNVLDLQPGTTYYLIIYTDNRNDDVNYNNLISETNESNNISATAFVTDQITPVLLGNSFDEKFSVSPNPATNSFDIDVKLMKSLASVNFYLYNSMGQVVWSKSGISNTSAKSITVPTETLPAGMYTLKVGNNNGWKEEKIVIQ